MNKAERIIERAVSSTFARFHKISNDELRKTFCYSDLFFLIERMLRETAQLVLTEDYTPEELANAIAEYRWDLVSYPSEVKSDNRWASLLQ